MIDVILRPYQTADIDRLRAEYAQGKRAPIYQLATGGGKTICFAQVVKGAVAKGKRTLVMAHRRELITQASKKLDDLGVVHGIMAAGQDRDHDALVQVASIQTIANRLDKLPKFDLIVIDEAHHAVATTWSQLLASQPQAKLLGVTATPARLDGKGLGKHCGGHFDAIVCGPSMQQLVDDGFLAACKTFVPARQIDTTGLRKVAGDYAAGEELAQRASVVTGDAIVEYRGKADGKSAIAFCVTVEHAEGVAQAFRDAGLRAACVHGGTPKVERDELIASIGDGRLDILTSCELISEGLDVPSVGAVILLRPTGSLTMYLQQVGRGMRPKADGAPLIVLDHAGNSVRHGVPAELRTWSLDGVEKAPAAPPIGGTVEPGMGKPREIVEVAGVLVEAQADPLRRWRLMSHGEFKRARRSAWEAHAFARAHGYKPGWVHYFLIEQEQRQALRVQLAKERLAAQAV